MLTELIAALAPHAEDDLSLTARLSLRYGDLARHHFDTGRRAEALTAADDAVRRCEEPARHDPEHARWYARALISQAVYLAEPLSDELGLPRYAFQPDGEQPPPGDRADGLAALAATRRAIEVWEGLDPSDPRNREGLAQAHVFLGDRLEELGSRWRPRPGRYGRSGEFHALWPDSEASESRPAAALEHLGDQLERRLRRCPFDGGLIRLRTQELLPHGCCRSPWWRRASRAWSRMRSPRGCGWKAEVRRILRARSWRAVWRFDVRDAADGTPRPMTYPRRGMDAVTDRSAEAVAAELTDAFLNSPYRPPTSAHWRIAVWWEEEDHLDGSRFRRTYAPS